jgi:hypothetical protein
MGNFINDFYKPLPPWGKGLTIVAGIGALYWLYTLTQGSPSAASAGDVNTADAAIQQLAQSGVMPSISDSTFEAMSDDIVDSCNGCSTNVSKIMSDFQTLQNLADLYEWIKVFGTRTYQVCPLNFTVQTSGGFGSFTSMPMSLPAMLTANLSTDHLAALNTQLSTQGIQYSF